MKRHLTERELIEYEFKLAADRQMREIAGHLEACAACSKRLEQLRGKFAALELLREEAAVSEDLISRVVQQAGQPVGRRQARVIRFYGPAWAGAAAAVLLFGVLLVVGRFGRMEVEEREFGEAPSRPAIEEMMFDAKGERTEETGPDRYAALGSKPSLEMGTYHRTVGGRTRGTLTEDIEGEAIPEQAPFAPASAIELVVLPRRDEVQLTIYNSADLTLVRERRNLTLKRGWNWLQFMWANTLIDPTSLSLEPLEQADKIDIKQLVFPARLRELGRWLIRSEVSGQAPFEITYFTSGLSWRAFYMGTLDRNEERMQLRGYVRVGNNSGEDYENARTRLIVGKVHMLDEIAALAKRQYAYDRPGIKPPVERAWDEKGVVMLNGAAVLEDALYAGDRLGMLRPKEIKKEGLSEYFLYTIEGTETIPDKWGKRLMSFDVNDIKVKSLYKYDEERWGQQAIRFVAFANDEEHNLGQTPIPNGTMKIYNQADEHGYLSYVGGTDVKYIPVNEEVELNLGPARLVKVEPTLMEFRTDNYVYDKKGNIAGWDEIRTWNIEITNTRMLPIEIEITRGFGTAYWKLETDAAYEKHDATHARFKLNVEPRTKRTLEYTVTTYHGVREEKWQELVR
jgi:hypothetical protein